MSKHPDFILLNVGYTELNANWNWSGIFSPFARIYFVTEGGAKTKIGDEVYSLKPNHFYLIPPFTLHDDVCDSYFALYYIHFYEKVIRQESIFDVYHFPIEIAASSLGELLVKRLLDINPNRFLQHIDPGIYDNAPFFRRFEADNRKMPLHSSIETQGILYELMAGFLELMELKSVNKDKRVNQAIQYIHEHIDQRISVSDLAGLCCLTTDHLIRLFRKEMDVTPLQYINQKKMEKAQLFLATTSQPVQQIAMYLCMDNISYFNRMFRHFAGKTPSQFRNDSFSI